MVVRFAVELRWDSLVSFAQSNSLDLKAAIPALHNLVQGDSVEVRRFVAEALASMGVRETVEPGDKWMYYTEVIQFLYSLRWFGAKFGLGNTLKRTALA